MEFSIKSKIWRRFKTEIVLCIIACIAGIYFYFPAFFNRFIIADDARICLYWIPKLHNHLLFQNDFLTDYAQAQMPWGFTLLYFLISFAVDPVYAGNYVAVICIVLTCLYLYKILNKMVNPWAGLLAAAFFLLNHQYFSRMAGGLPRSFGYPLLAMFLFYMIDKRIIKASVVLIMQTLFYPVIFILSVPLYLFSLLEFTECKLRLTKSRKKIVIIIVCLGLCGLIVAGKYLFFSNPKIGKTLSKEKIIHQMEYYRGIGRWNNLLPLRPVAKEAGKYLASSNQMTIMLFKDPRIPILYNQETLLWIWYFLIGVFLIREHTKKRLLFPIEIVVLFAAGILSYLLASFFLFKLYIPVKYIRYSMAIVGIIFVAAFIAQILKKWRNRYIIGGAFVCILIFMALNVDIRRNTYLINVSNKKPLYDFIGSLPTNSVIAAYPLIADDIPTFAKRITYINYELSNPIFDQAWKTLRKRTLLFFNAYYAQDPGELYRFCLNNEIDYILVNKMHYNRLYLEIGQFYFEPFNSFVKYLVRKRNDFVLNNIEEEDMIFKDFPLYIIKSETLIKYEKRRP